jgi:tetrahydromethanopterin S-methyltransferase subunit F
MKLRGKHASTTIGLIFGMVFSILSVQSGYKEENWGNN